MGEVKYVQIAEAHAEDEWPIGNVYNPLVPVVKQQTVTLVARMKEAREYDQRHRLQSRGIQVVCDDPSEAEFENALAPWPTRAYILDGEGKLVAMASNQHGILSLDPIRNFIVSQKEARL